MREGYANDGYDFRLNAVYRIKEEFEKELTARKKFKKRYKTFLNIADGVEYASGIGATVCGATTVGLFSTGVGVPIALLNGLGIAASVVSGIISIAVKKKLLQKYSKHDRICILAIAKYNSLNQIIATALQDQKISDEEFKIVMDEKDKYTNLKNEIVSKKGITDTKGNADVDALKNELIRLLSAAKSK